MKKTGVFRGPVQLCVRPDCVCEILEGWCVSSGRWSCPCMYVGVHACTEENEEGEGGCDGDGIGDEVPGAGSKGFS